MLHIYTAPAQPATAWVDSHSAEPMQMGWAPDDLLWCSCCGQQRRAADCVVHSYYDDPMVYCAPDPQVIAEKKAREFSSRSAGQQSRWAKTKTKEQA